MNDNQIMQVVEAIESQHADIDWTAWQKICEILEQRSHQI